MAGICRLRVRALRALVACFSAYVCSAYGQEGPVEWRFFTYFAPGDKPVQLNRAFADEVNKATGGRLRIKVFAGGEMPYKAADVVRVVASNQVQMGDVAVGFASGELPELNVLSLPFLCSSYSQFEQALPGVRPIVDETLQKRFGITTVMHWTMPPQNFWLNKPITKLSELRGLKIRSWNSEQVEMMRLLGGSAVSITSAEVIPALERKVIDGAITSAFSANDWRAYEIVKTGYIVNMTMGHQILLINSEQLNKLPADVNTILLAKAKEWEPKYREMSEKGDEGARKNLQDNKVRLVEPSKQEMAEARQLMRPMWDQWAKRHGDTGAALLSGAMKACGAT